MGVRLSSRKLKSRQEVGSEPISEAEVWRTRAGACAVGEIWRVHTFRETAPLRAPDGGALPNESVCVCLGRGGIGWGITTAFAPRAPHLPQPLKYHSIYFGGSIKPA